MILETLKSALSEEYNKPRKGVHVSDLTLCPREVCFRRLYKEPVTDVEMNFYSSGKAIHEALQVLVKANPDFEIEKEVWLGDIVAHIDLFDKKYHVPIEAKSARVSEVTRDQIYGIDTSKSKIHYLKQLEAYMAMTGASTGRILVQCLMHFKDKPFVEFEHTMTEEERKNTILKLQADAILFKEGLAAKDPSLVRHVADDKQLNWKCTWCKYAKPCQEMRDKETAEKLKK